MSISESDWKTHQPTKPTTIFSLDFSHNFCQIDKQMVKRHVHTIRGGKIGPIRCASSVRPELGSGWAIKL